MKKKSVIKKTNSKIKVIYASKKEVEKATQKCLKLYPDVFKELAKR